MEEMHFLLKTIKILILWTQKILITCPIFIVRKIEETIMSLKDADGMANSVECRP